MKFSPRKVKFTLKDVGSEIIDQLSSDVYTGPDAILRELIKNAYDAYIGFDLDVVDDDTERKITITRERDAKGVGHILISDDGIGQSLDELKGNVQISISKKQETLDHATGFRGLGSWAMLGAGSSIVITSSKYGNPKQVRLEIFVREIYKRLNPNVSLDDILNDTKCIKFSDSKAASDVHFTTVDIVCDGPQSKVANYEINRLYKFTDPEDVELRKVLVKSCPIPFASDSTIYPKLESIYERIGYEPTAIFLDGEALERRVPATLKDFQERTLTGSGADLAIAWTVEDSGKTGEVSKKIDEGKHLLGGPSIQVLKYNVPIGEKGMFSDNVRSTILNWYVGEVHVLADDVRPDAGGQNFRAGSAREHFIQKLREHYKGLEKRAEDKSTRLSLVKALQKGEGAARKLQEGKKCTPTETSKLEATIATAVEKIADLGKRGKPKTVVESRVFAAKKTKAVQEAKKSALKTLKDLGYWDKYKPSSETNKKSKKKTSKTKSSKKKKAAGTNTSNGNPIHDIRALLGRAIPRFKQAGLTDEQIDAVLEILQDLLSN